MKTGLEAGAGLYGERRARSLPTIRGDYTQESSSFRLGWLDKTTCQVIDILKPAPPHILALTRSDLNNSAPHVLASGNNIAGAVIAVRAVT